MGITGVYHQVSVPPTVDYQLATNETNEVDSITRWITMQNIKYVKKRNMHSDSKSEAKMRIFGSFVQSINKGSIRDKSDSFG